ncbi:MAG: MCE family protein [Bdellovibrionales bacterium]|nr:MCE family protein [Bdellovibrionales bacterium]
MKKYLIKKLLVGTILIVGIVIFSIYVVVIGSNQGGLLGRYIKYKTQLKDSSGLYVGSKVNIQGAKTGNVLKLAILQNGVVEVVFSVKKIHLFMIRTSSFVEIKNSGALGDRYINIITKDFSGSKLKSGSLIPYKKNSSLISFFLEGNNKSHNSLQNIFKQLESLLEQVSEKGVLDVLSKKEGKEFSELLKNANLLLKSTDEFVNRTNRVLKKIEQGQGTLGALINDPSLYNRVLVLLGERPKNNYLEDLSSPKKRK